MKKNLLMVIVAVLALILVLVIMFGSAVRKQSTDVSENVYKVEDEMTVQGENYGEQSKVILEDENMQVRTLNLPGKRENIKVHKADQNKVNTINSEVLNDKAVENTVSERKFTPEEEELLKKIPRSKEVLVDKEIKLKSSGRYIFR